MNCDEHVNLIVPRAAADRLGARHEETLRQLLREMIAGIRRYLATPLQEMIDSVGISSAAIRNLSIQAGNGSLGALRDWDAVELGLDNLVRRALLAEIDGIEIPELPSNGRFSDTCHQPFRGEWIDSLENANRLLDRVRLNPLALWLDDFFNAVREIHPRAIEIVQLRLDGYPSREIADRLGMGLRMVQRMTYDLHLALSGRRGRSES